MLGYAQLSFEERQHVATWHAAGLSNAAIARRLGRHRSTIGRELRRNALPRGGYTAVHAEGGYIAKRQRAAMIERDDRLKSFVHQRLLAGWTPEQIAGWLARGEERNLRSVCCETIYAFIYRARQKAEQLWKLLPRGRSKRGRLKARQPKNVIAERRSIHDRPESVEQRQETGHWEADFVICNKTRPVLVITERRSRLTLAAKLFGKTAGETVAMLMSTLDRLDPRLRRSITFDNDTAFAQHGLLKRRYDIQTWFCDAYASWQKGTVENTNGRLRRNLPRQLDIDQISQAELQEIILSHNLTPRKCLGYLTPVQAMLKALGKDVRIRFA